MDFRDTPEDAAFRREVRDFLDAELANGFGRASGLAAAADEDPDSRRGGVDRYGVYWDWMKKLARKGWIAPAWPKEYGGAGMTVMQQFVFNEEMARGQECRRVLTIQPPKA